MNSTQYVDHIIFSNYVRYEQLTNIIEYVYRDSSADHMNIFFDMYPIIRSTCTNETTIIFNTPVDIAAGVVNLCAHYRHFFARFGVDTTIYIVCGYNCPIINTKMVPDYNRAMVTRLAGSNGKMIQAPLKSNIQMLKILCPYLSDIHFIYTEYETSVVIASLIDLVREKGNRDPNLVISKDSYPLQLVTCCPNTAYLRPKKSGSEDHSYILRNPENPFDYELFWRTYYGDRSLKNWIADIHPSNVTLISTLSSYPQRSINLLSNITKAHSMIRDVVGDSFVECSLASIIDNNEDYLKKKNIGSDLLKDRYHALDVRFQLEAFYKSSEEFKSMIFENKIDPNALEAINSKYFSDNPLNLNKL